MHYSGVRNGKKEKDKKKAKDAKENLVSWFSFTKSSIFCKCIQNLKTLAVLGAEKSVTKNLYWRKRKKEKGKKKSKESNFGRGSLKEHSCKIISKSIYRFRRRCLLSKLLTDA